jgi:hypothetical protein
MNAKKHKLSNRGNGKLYKCIEIYFQIPLKRKGVCLVYYIRFFVRFSIAMNR